MNRASLARDSHAESMNLQEAIEETSEQIQIRLKDKQIEAISSFCSGRDVFVSLFHKI